MGTFFRAATVTPRLAVAFAFCIGCAEAPIATTDPLPTSSSAGGGDGTGGAVAASSSASGGMDLVDPQSCPAGSFATGFGEDGTLQCAPPEQALISASASEGCSLYGGWRDSCNGCNDAPSKWGKANGSTCAIGSGGDNTCGVLADVGADVPLLGLNTDGDVNGDDKFSVGLYCDDLSQSPLPGPCQAGEFVSNVHGQFVECRPVSSAVVDYVRDACSLFFGWRDSCDGCNNAPTKWGRIAATDCLDGAGNDNSCYAPFLGQQWIPQFGVNTDGDVNGDDKFYLGMHCADAATITIESALPCPFGTFMTGINADGTLTCASLAVAETVQAGCRAYFGWRDSCNGCSDAPAKYGSVSTGACALSAGGDSGCLSATLDETEVELLGINTDGDVNGDDKFYFGWRCQ